MSAKTVKAPKTVVACKEVGGILGVAFVVALTVVDAGHR